MNGIKLELFIYIITTESLTDIKKVTLFSSSFCANVSTSWGGDLHDVMANMLDCNILANEFELQSCFYIHFRANSLGKGMNPLIHHLQLCVKMYDYSSTTRMTLALKIDMPLKKETKLNQLR